MTRFDRTNLKLLRTTLNRIIQTAAKEHNVTLEIGSCTFSDTSATFKLEVTAADIDGNTPTKIEVDFKSYAPLFGLQPTDLGRTFTHHSSTFTICGLKPKSRKFPIIAQGQNGKKYKFSTAVVKYSIQK